MVLPTNASELEKFVKPWLFVIIGLVVIVALVAFFSKLWQRIQQAT